MLFRSEDGSYPPELVNGPDQKPFSTLDDMVGEDEIWFMATSSIMFRKGLFETYPDWFFKSKSGDIPRSILWAKHGKVGYLPDVMSVYRKNQGGMSFTDYKHDAEFLFNRIEMYQAINQELNYVYDRRVRRNVARYYRMLLDSEQFHDRYWKRGIFAMTYLRLASPDKATTKEILKTYLIPRPVLKVYSMIRLLPHRLTRQSN